MIDLENRLKNFCISALTILSLSINPVYSADYFAISNKDTKKIELVEDFSKIPSFDIKSQDVNKLVLEVDRLFNSIVENRTLAISLGNINGNLYQLQTKYLQDYLMKTNQMDLAKSGKINIDDILLSDEFNSFFESKIKSNFPEIALKPFYVHNSFFENQNSIEFNGVNKINFQKFLDTKDRKLFLFNLKYNGFNLDNMNDFNLYQEKLKFSLGLDYLSSDYLRRVPSNVSENDPFFPVYNYLKNIYSKDDDLWEINCCFNPLVITKKDSGLVFIFQNEPNTQNYSFKYIIPLRKENNTWLIKDKNDSLDFYKLENQMNNLPSYFSGLFN